MLFTETTSKILYTSFHMVRPPENRKVCGGRYIHAPAQVLTMQYVYASLELETGSDLNALSIDQLFFVCFRTKLV